MRIKVYIFEDNWMCREALVSVLGQENGIDITGSTDDVRKGIEEVIKIEPDIILMDIRFHQENLGIEAASILVKKLPETKIIIFTEFHDEENLRNAINAGASGFLLKKEVQDPKVIINAIRTVYQGDAYITPSMTVKILSEIKRLSSEKHKYDLTKRELEILRVLSEGHDNKKIAQIFNIDVRTVANHVSNILFKMSAKNRTEAVVIAKKEGII